MFFIILAAQNTPDYTPQLIGVAGTLLGTVLGWVLHLISNNIGRIHIFLDAFDNQRSKNNEYAYIVKLYIHNDSYKQQCIRNVRFLFAKSRCKILFESIPVEGRCTFDTLKAKKKEKISLFTINSYAQSEFTFSDLIDEKNFEKLSEVRKIYLVYEDKKNITKKKLIKSNFQMANVKQCDNDHFL